ncbi:MAG: protein kinase, partial [Planctomycetes bacterium]|nr:protein kinase [Planctomycetota bacterium]
MPEPLIDRTVRNYRVLRRLGEGGMGTVYLARTVRAGKGLPPGTEVALKVLHPHLAGDEDTFRRFRREAGVGLAIRHPRVMATYDVGTERKKGATIHFIVMEYLTGLTLRQRLDAEIALPDRLVASIGRQVAEGLAEIHARGMIHRDIKLSNLFIDEAGGVKIADLGLSRLLEPHSEISLPGSFLGSVAYAAPEQFEGEDVGPAADLYSLGVTLYELASGQNPFAGVDLRSTLRAHTRLVAPPLGESAPETSFFLERLVQALLHKDPARRLGPARLVAEALASRERSEWWREFVRGNGPGAVGAGPRRQFRVLRATRLYGRAREFADLRDALRTAVVGRSGRAALVLGEAGGGKTRLIDAAMEDPDVEGAAALAVSRFLELATPLPYYPLSDALLELLGLRGARREERRERLPGLLREHLPERGVFADAFAALIDGREPSLAFSRVPQDAIPALYAEAFRTLSVRRPLVLVIEELQWADRVSL